MYEQSQFDYTDVEWVRCRKDEYCTLLQRHVFGWDDDRQRVLNHPDREAWLSAVDGVV